MSKQNFRAKKGLEVGIGGTILNTTSTGNIGIGTTNPQTKLEINGVLGFSTDVNNWNNIRIGSKTTGASVTPNNPNTGDGLNNIFIGVGAGSSTTSGSFNNFLGYQAGYYNTTGSDNNFFSRETGFFNTTGTYNNFFGIKAGYYNTTGSNNNFIGQRAGYSNIIGVRNNFIGYGAGYYNTEGNRNNFVGFYGGYKNATGNYNNFVGNYSGISTSASRKVILGSGYNYSNLFDSPDTTKDFQFAVGVRTDANPSKYWLVGNENFNIGIGTTNPTTKLQVGGIIGFNDTNVRIGDNTTGALIEPNKDNIFIGVGAGQSTSGNIANQNVFIGKNAGQFNRNGYGNVFLGVGAGQTNGDAYTNTFVGGFSGVNNATGNNNSFFGSSSGLSNVSGTTNNFFGSYAGYYNTTGNNNTFLGAYSGISTSASNKIIFGTGGSYNQLFDSPDTTKDIQFAVGVRTDANESKYWLVGNENFNIGIGTTNPTTKLQVGGVIGFNDTNVRIGDNNTGANLTSGNDNIFIGRYAGNSNTVGGFNNFIGAFAGRVNDYSFNNNFFGYQSGYSNTTGNRNNFFGWSSGVSNETANDNSFFGERSGYYNTIGNNNTFLGSYSGFSTSASYKVIIGSGSWNSGTWFDAPDTTKDIQFAVGVRTDANPSKYWLVGNENFNVGIGTTNPQTKLQVGGVIGFNDTNIRIGDNTTGSNLTSGQQNIFVGAGAGNSTTTGNFNNFIGQDAGQFNTTGSDNNFFGFSGGYKNTTGNSNSFFGDSAGFYNTVGNNNAFFGAYAGVYNTIGNFNTLFGSYTGLSTSASNKVIIGRGYEWSPTGYFDAPDPTKDTQFAVGIRTDANPSKYWLVGNENFNVGIGTTNPTSKLFVLGDGRITGILSVGQGTITLDGNTDTLTVPNLVVTSTSTGVANLGAVLAATYNMLMP